MVDVPQQEGFSASSRLIGERCEKYAMDFGKAEGLYRFTDQVQFFTPALLYLYGRFTDEPFVQFSTEVDPGLQVMHHRFAEPIFTGFEAMNGDPDWNYVLWGVQVDKYPQLENYMLSISLTSPSEGWLCRVGAQDLEIQDPLYVDRNPVLSLKDSHRIPIVVWGVDSTAGALAVEVEDGLFSLPRLKRHPAQLETLAEARALYSGGNPLEAREASLREQQGEDDAGNS